MPNSYTCLRYHLIFSTRDRRPLLEPAILARLHAFIGGIVRDLRGVLLEAGGMPDHVHLLVSGHPQVAVSDLLRDIKAGTSRWLHQTFPELRAFAWQDGYGAFAVSASNTEDVRAYIRAQAEHHRRVTFEEEFLAFLRRHGVPFDERYVLR